MRIKRFVTAKIVAPALLWSAIFGAATGFQSELAVFAASPQDESTKSEDAKSASDVDPDDVLDWVAELDADSLAARKKAEAKLIEAGPGVLKHLPNSDKDLSAEASARLKRVRDALQKALARFESRAKSISIRLSGCKTVGEALEAISRDSGIEFDGNFNASQSVPEITAPLSFWHAVDTVLDAAELDIDFYGGDNGTLALISRESSRPSRVDSAAYTGVYRLEPATITATRSLITPEMDALNVGMQISWRPGLTPIGLTIPTQQLIARLDNGKILKPQSDAGSIEIGATQSIAVSDFYLPLNLPAGRPAKIVAISGVIRAILPGPMKQFEVPVRGDGPTQKINSLNVTLSEIRANGELTEMRVLVKLDDAGDSLQSHRQWLFNNEVYLKNDSGERIDHLGYEVYRQTNDSVGVGYLFDVDGGKPGYTMIYRSPTTVTPNEVPFILQNVPLP